MPCLPETRAPPGRAGQHPLPRPHCASETPPLPRASEPLPPPRPPRFCRDSRPSCAGESTRLCCPGQADSELAPRSPRVAILWQELPKPLAFRPSRAFLWNRIRNLQVESRRFDNSSTRSVVLLRRVRVGYSPALVRAPCSAKTRGRPRHLLCRGRPALLPLVPRTGWETRAKAALVLEPRAVALCWYDRMAVGCRDLVEGYRAGTVLACGPWPSGRGMPCFSWVGTVQVQLSRAAACGQYCASCEPRRARRARVYMLCDCPEALRLPCLVRRVVCRGAVCASLALCLWLSVVCVSCQRVYSVCVTVYCVCVVQAWHSLSSRRA